MQNDQSITTKSEFRWDDIYSRRQQISAGIQRRLGLSFSLGVKEPFSALSLTSQDIADEPMWRIPFYVIAQRMIAEMNHYRIIDHAWWLLSQDRVNEPWGFVTEPYINETEAERVAQQIRRRHARWGIEVEVLPKAEAAWLPGSTVPIVTTATVGCLPEFLRNGVQAAVECMNV